jgi:hypothetical protein
MKPSRVPNGNSLFRHSIHPASFRGRAFATDKLWNLNIQSDGSLLGSLVWERYAPTQRDVHEHGCRLALKRNDAKRQAGTYKEKSRQVYCGAYRLEAKAIRALPSDQLAGVKSADVIHHIENGEIAHTDLRILLVQGHFDIEGTKTAILDRLWYVCTGPLKHICTEDKDVAPHPNSNLTTPPSGSYTDTRSWFSRVLYRVKFRWLVLAHKWAGDV